MPGQLPILCTHRSTWTNYKGCNTRLREHFKKKHEQEYQREVDSRDLKKTIAISEIDEELERELVLCVVDFPQVCEPNCCVLVYNPSK